MGIQVGRRPGDAPFRRSGPPQSAGIGLALMMQPRSLGKISLQVCLSDPRRVSAGPELANLCFLRGKGGKCSSQAMLCPV